MYTPLLKRRPYATKLITAATKISAENLKEVQVISNLSAKA